MSLCPSSIFMIYYHSLDPPPPPTHTHTHTLFKGGSKFNYLPWKGLSFLHLEITLPFAKICYAFKGHSKLSKNEPENIP